MLNLMVERSWFVVLMNPRPPQRRLLNTARGVLEAAEHAIFYYDGVQLIVRGAIHP